MFAETVDPNVAEGTLIITSSIYSAFQRLDAVRVLRQYGLDIETVGLQEGRRGKRHPSSAYRQELRSGKISADRLLLEGFNQQFDG